MQLTKTEESSLKELFLRGIAAVGIPAELTAESLIPVLRAGLDASQEFAQEMLEGRTARSKDARDVLAAEVYGRCVLNEARKDAFQRIEYRANAAGVASARLAMFNEVVL